MTFVVLRLCLGYMTYINCLKVVQDTSPVAEWSKLTQKTVSRVASAC
jgi:hypothetical protein